MNLTIKEKFTEIHKRGTVGLMTHTVCGYPDLATTEKIVKTLISAGSDFIELQIPFSEPIADGAVFFQANQEALKNKVKVSDCFELMKMLSSNKSTPLLFMTYYNIIFNYGLEKFIKKAKDVGAKGLIVPDIPIEEGQIYFRLCQKHKIDAIRIIAPTTPEERVKQICRGARGFLYCVGRTGITGAKTDLNKGLGKYLEIVKRYSQVPLGVGFGIRTNTDVKKISRVADLAIVGTMITKTYFEQGIEGVKNLVKTLKMGG